jgi:hypothetical protein
MGRGAATVTPAGSPTRTVSEAEHDGSMDLFPDHPGNPNWIAVGGNKKGGWTGNNTNPIGPTAKALQRQFSCIKFCFIKMAPLARKQFLDRGNGAPRTLSKKYH